jgi:hypothetical protein
MSNNEAIDPKQTRPTLGTSELAAGGGTGGALVFAINTYVVDAKLQTLLIYLVPTISIVAMGLYSFGSALIANNWKSFESERTRRKLLNRAKAGLADAKLQLKAIEADPESTAEHKALARERVQKFERAVLELHAKGIVVID